MPIALSLFMVVSISLVGFVSWYLAYESAQNSLKDFSKLALKDVEDKISIQINFHISIAEKSVFVNKNYFREGFISMQNKPAVLPIYRNQLLQFKDYLATLTFTSEAGELWGLFKYKPKVGNEQLRMWNQYGNNLTYYKIDERGNILSMIENDLNANSTTGDWVTIVDKTSNTSASWTSMYAW
ncbi:hypothetical protein ROZALSC1DRAFT_21968, partial [Rozella allomycis CSF55]